MKYLYPLVLSLTVFLCFFGNIAPAFAQDATESVAALNKVDRPVFEATYAYSAKIVEDALKKKLEKDHISSKQKRNTITCKGVVYPLLSTNPLDIYFLTEERGRKKNRTTMLKMFVSKGRDNFIGEKYDAELAGNALDLLNKFNKEVEYYALTQEIDAKEKAFKKVTSNYNSLLDSRKKLQDQLYNQRTELGRVSGKDLKKVNRKIKRASKKIRRTDKKISKTEKTMQEQRSKLESLRNRLSDMQR